jgi:hypothetical protein
VVRFNRRTPSALSSACTWSLTVVVDKPRLRAAEVNPLLSATRTNAVMLVRRSMRLSDYPM